MALIRRHINKSANQVSHSDRSTFICMEKSDILTRKKGLQSSSKYIKYILKNILVKVHKVYTKPFLEEWPQISIVVTLGWCD